MLILQSLEQLTDIPSSADDSSDPTRIFTLCHCLKEISHGYIAYCSVDIGYWNYKTHVVMVSIGVAPALPTFSPADPHFLPAPKCMYIFSLIIFSFLQYVDKTYIIAMICFQIFTLSFLCNYIYVFVQ